MRPQEHTRIVFLTDLGTIRAFRLPPRESPFTPRQGPPAIEEIKLSDRVSGRPNRFPNRRNESIPMHPGENHHKKTESESRRISFLAQEIERLLAEEGIQPWCLAAPPTINNRILEKISHETREFLAANIRSNLTHIKPRELEERFVHPTPGS